MAKLNGFEQYRPAPDRSRENGGHVIVNLDLHDLPNLPSVRTTDLGGRRIEISQASQKRLSNWDKFFNNHSQQK